ncbi:TRAP transporter small permease [Alkalicella caledoniensis]|uniref:TRAP transporter small permease n=1 Tax=Alkalicella caledoniensis TaxID=2731377 RepID=A0A7G9W7P9_ALKCA|nr:TRAP transporter small permease [Alkalicella caledoniensis]QNO14711.1 TRAP transporter small permease [Alkalicella caledoniensis]
MSILKKVDQILSKLEAFILSFGVIAMSLLLIGNVIMRAVFNNSWSFAEEIGQFMVVVVTFVGISYATRKGKHIRMTAIYDMSSFKVKKILTLIVSFVTMVVMFYFAYLGLRYTLMVASRGRVTPALEWARYVVVMFFPIGFFMGGVQNLVNFVLNVIHKDEIYSGNEGPDKEAETFADLTGITTSEEL